MTNHFMSYKKKYVQGKRLQVVVEHLNESLD